MLPKGVAMTPETSEMKSFTTIVNDHKPLTIVAKLSTLDVWMGPGYVSGPT